MQQQFKFLQLIVALICSHFACANEIITESPTAYLRGTPVVYHGMPNQDGISLIAFEKFNISAKGLIFNNSTNTTDAKLVGLIPGNPHLQGRPATLIIAQVTHPGLSELKGKLEVAGHRADVIIANPWGIRCDDCGFSNVRDATLATSRLEFSQNNVLQNHIVQQGNITITEKGLNGQGLNSLTLISHTLNLHGPVRLSKDQNKNSELHIYAGALQIEAKKGGKSIPLTLNQPSAEYLIDVGPMGGMYADTIFLSGTTTELGIKHHGVLNANHIHINYKGDLLVGEKTQIKGPTSINGTINVKIAVDTPARIEQITTIDHTDLGSVVKLAQKRQIDIAETKRQEGIAEAKRQADIAEAKRQADIAEARRQTNIAEAKRQADVAEAERQAKIAAAERLAQRMRNDPIGTMEEIIKTGRIL